jgi:hypothetical protein
MKGEIQTDFMPVNKYELQVLGLVKLVAVTISGIEDELETIDLPDRTKGTGGQRKATSFKLGTPMHHATEQAAMEIWYKESQDPVSPTYKKPCTLIHKSLSGNNSRSYTLVGVFPMKRTLPDLEKKNEGDMAIVEWEMSVDDIFPL